MIMKVIKCLVSPATTSSSIQTLRRSFLYHLSNNCCSSHTRRHDKDPRETPYGTLSSLAKELRHYSMFDIRFAKADDNTRVFEYDIIYKMNAFRRGAHKYICRRIRNDPNAWGLNDARFGTYMERKAMGINSLKSVCKYLNLNVPATRPVRHKLAKDIITYSLWFDTLTAFIRELDSDLRTISRPSTLVKDILVSTSKCLQLLDANDLSRSNWTDIPKSFRKIAVERYYNKEIMWIEILLPLRDITEKMLRSKALKSYVKRIRGMKEGLFHMQKLNLDNILLNTTAAEREEKIKHIFFFEMTYGSSLSVTLLNYFLNHSVSNLFVDMRGRFHIPEGSDTPHIYMGEIVTFDDEVGMIRTVRHLDRAMRFAHFLYEHSVPDAKPPSIEGHIWGSGVVERVIEYRNMPFYVHSLEC